ncbi:hypothetical protein CEXT_38091 [Caerostris extrusa]|uniref:Uncharacterized protein n=1 Tax=Caerostris extrusa TaxID=172846 RepID=A0AAV4PSV0_CAEEX|nr:hypothetical protein CEXT_38091 [Caerostris extrusa]
MPILNFLRCVAPFFPLNVPSFSTAGKYRCMIADINPPGYPSKYDQKGRRSPPRIGDKWQIIQELEGTMECFIGNSPYGGRCLEVRFCEVFEYAVLSLLGLFTGAVMGMEC